MLNLPRSQLTPVTTALTGTLFLSILTFDWVNDHSLNMGAAYAFGVFVSAWAGGYLWSGIMAVVSWYMILHASDFEPFYENDYQRDYQRLANEFAVVFALLLIVLVASRLGERYRMSNAGARKDDLTGIANRAAFIEHLDDRIRELRRAGGGKLAGNQSGGAEASAAPFSVAYLDCDGFKQVNDIKGHAAGDQLLRDIARQFQQRTRGSDTIARLGGDEFTLLLPHSDTEQGLMIAQRLKTEMDEYFGKIDPPVGFSVGMVTFYEAPANAEAALEFADQMMYAAKRARDGTVKNMNFGAPRDAYAGGADQASAPSRPRLNATISAP